MAETPLTVDLTRLRAVATRVERAAEEVDRCRFTWLPDTALAGSAVAGVAAPELIAARLDDLVTDLRDWAATARRAAGAFEAAEQNSVARLDRP